MVQDLKINKDYKYGYPFGLKEGAVLHVKTGGYSGLSVHLTSSWLESARVNNRTKHELTYTYSIINLWKKAPQIFKDTNKIILNSADQEFIYALVHSFIKATN